MLYYTVNTEIAQLGDFETGIFYNIHKISTSLNDFGPKECIYYSKTSIDTYVINLEIETENNIHSGTVYKVFISTNKTHTVFTLDDLTKLCKKVTGDGNRILKVDSLTYKNKVLQYRLDYTSQILCEIYDLVPPKY